MGIEIYVPFALLLHIFIAFTTHDLVHDINIILGLAFGSIGIKSGSNEVQSLSIGC